jgi:hypothetical protein
MQTGTNKTPMVQATLAFLIVASIALPSGTFLGIPVKHIAYLSSLASILYTWINRAERIPTKIIILTVCSLAYVLLYAIIGGTKGIANPTQAIQEATGVFTTISIVLLGIICIEQKWVLPLDIVRYAVWGTTIFSTIKNIAALSMAIGATGFNQTVVFFLTYFNSKFVSSAIFGGLVRVNIIIYDFVVLLIFSLCILYPEATKKCSKSLLIYFKASAILCIFFAFSRYLYACAGLVLLYALIFKWDWRAKIAVLAIITPIATLNAAWLAGAIEQRFTASQNATSDDKRTEQMAALVNQWSTSPWIGGGFGSYAKSLIRDPITPYSYEVQWFGFFAKLGIIGMSYVMLLIILAYHAILKNNSIKITGPLAGLFTLFLIGGFTNQYLVTSGSGVFYLVTICTAYILREQARFSGE